MDRITFFEVYLELFITEWIVICRQLTTICKILQCQICARAQLCWQNGESNTIKTQSGRRRKDSKYKFGSQMYKMMALMGESVMKMSIVEIECISVGGGVVSSLAEW